MRIAMLLLAGLGAFPAAAEAQRAPPAGFTIQVAYSPRAAAEMIRRREALTVSAVYEGTPTRAARRHVNEDGSLTLGSETITVPGRPGPVTITGRGFQANHLSWIQPGSARVNVNLYSARRGGPDNILDCGLVDGPLREIAGRTHRVRCKLIGEQ